MDAVHSCRCCLQCAPDRSLTTPYTHLGRTEIYSDMLKECFNIQLGAGGAGECGICAACVGRLRDASDFKLQVQRSQAELQARLQIIDEVPVINPDVVDKEDVEKLRVRKRLQHLEFGLESIKKKPRVVESNNGNSLENKINQADCNIPNKNQEYHNQKVPDYWSNSKHDEDIVTKPSIPHDLLSSMERRLLDSLQISNVSGVHQDPQDIQDTGEISSEDGDSSEVPKAVPPVKKISTKDNFIDNFIGMMKDIYEKSSDSTVELHKSYNRSNEILGLIKKQYDSRISKENKAKTAVVEEAPEKDEDDSSSDSDEDDSNEDEPLKKTRDIRRDYVLPPEYDPKDTRWTLKYRKNDQKLPLEELIPGSKVYVDSIKLAHCKRSSKEAKGLCRMLLAEIFSLNALKVCSLTGARANAFHNNGTYVRPGLDANARETMFKFVEEYGNENQWAAFDKRSVICSVRSRVQEIRSKHTRDK